MLNLYNAISTMKWLVAFRPVWFHWLSCGEFWWYDNSTISRTHFGLCSYSPLTFTMFWHFSYVYLSFQSVLACKYVGYHYALLNQMMSIHRPSGCVDGLECYQKCEQFSFSSRRLSSKLKTYSWSARKCDEIFVNFLFIEENLVIVWCTHRFL